MLKVKTKDGYNIIFFNFLTPLVVIVINNFHKSM